MNQYINNIIQFNECNNNTKIQLNQQLQTNRHTHQHKLTTCYLNICQYSAGSLNHENYNKFLNVIKQLNYSNQLKTMHGNFLRGNLIKMDLMKKYGLWIYDDIKMKCNNNITFKMLV